jgi:hypothetical protein
LVGVIAVCRLWPVVDWSSHLAPMVRMHQMTMYCPVSSRRMVFYSPTGVGGNGDFQHLVDSIIPEQ